MHLFRRGWHPLALLLVAALVGCGPDQPEANCSPEQQVLDSGLRYRDLRCGEGEVAARGHVATVSYSGQVMGGPEFDSSDRRGGSFTFRLGVGQVVPGWDEGLVGMQVGGTRRLVIPPDLAYGDAGFPPDVPPGATVVYEVELLELKKPEL